MSSNPHSSSSVQQQQNPSSHNNPSGQISVYIITGFLGAGKTTLLNSLLQQLKDQRNFVIENEVGQVNIDKGLIRGNVETIFEITNGCLCCNLDTDLYNALDQIARLPEKPDNVFIETTGIADAGNLTAIFHEEFVAQVFHLRKTLCVVDAEVIEDFIQRAAESARQIVSADLVVLNKIGKIGAAYLEEVRAMVRKMNPYAPVIESFDGSMDQNDLSLQTGVRPMFSLNTSQPATVHDISTVLFTSNELFDIEQVEIILRSSLFIYYKDIFRIKGYLQHKTGNWYLLQSAGKTISITEVSDYQEQSFLVFIGRKLTLEIAQRLLRPTMVKP
jgi:G3E family GTPase